MSRRAALLRRLESRPEQKNARLADVFYKPGWTPAFAGVRRSWGFGVAALALASFWLGTGEPPAPARAQPPASVPQSPYPLRPLWGDTHLHTANSFDAFTAGNRLGPEEALRFARGEEVTSSTGLKAKLARPLDFLVITDHSNNLGAMREFYETPNAQIDDPQLKRWHSMMHGSSEDAGKALRELLLSMAKGQLPKTFANPESQKAVVRRVWDAHLAAVERYNQPGQFTAFAGFEYTLAPGGNVMHRNVIFRDGADRASKVLPLPADNKAGPDRVWDYMDAYAKATGGQMLAIPHNPNQSNGLAFPITDASGGPMTADMARRRIAHEPLVEVTQIKGDSETHPFLSPNDEFANFGRDGWDLGNGQLTKRKTNDMFATEYVRQTLRNGLRIQQQTGVNPYQFGLIGSTDAHTSLSTADEDNYFGKLTVFEPGPSRLNQSLNDGEANGRLSWQFLAGGYAAVWATANTREAIFDAMLRREVYASTGPRMTVRLFGGRDFTAKDWAGDWVKAGYARGVPMGGTLKPGKGAPVFLVLALKDPVGANLDRIQIVKGWIDRTGATHEQVFDVAWSSPTTRKRMKGKLTPVGDTVDLRTATYANSIGAAELRTLWRDPAYKSGERAFYYARVLEIPTPRWTAYDAVRFKVTPPPGTTLKAQERAYTSPIWVEPA